MDPHALLALYAMPWPNHRGADRADPDWKTRFMVNDHGGAGVGLAQSPMRLRVVALHLHLENLSALTTSSELPRQGLKAAGAVKQRQKVDREIGTMTSGTSCWPRRVGDRPRHLYHDHGGLDRGL